jgi:hypothetical protein
MTIYWTFNNGDKIPIENMTTRHIERILDYLLRSGYVGQSDVSFYLGCDEPRGDGAQDAFNLEFDYVTNASINPFIDIFRAELKLRKNMGIGNGQTRRSGTESTTNN